MFSFALYIIYEINGNNLEHFKYLKGGYKGMEIIAGLLAAIVVGGLLQLMGQQMMISIIAMIIVFLITRYVVSYYLNKDLLYIRSSLRLATRKNLQIQEYGKKWRMWKLWIRIRHIRKINNEIISTIQKQPNRFSNADKFFSLYLDSCLNILEKYNILVHQPMRSLEVQKSLRMTEKMLEDVIKGLEQELTYVLADDIKELEIEKEVIHQYVRQ